MNVLRRLTMNHQFLRVPALLGALIGGTCLSARAGETSVESPPAPIVASHQDLLFLGTDRLLVIRLQLEVDGKPFVESRREYIESLFALADRNADGNLSTEEFQPPPGEENPLSSELFALLTSSGLAQADTSPPDGSLSSEEFTQFVTRQRGGAFQVSSRASDSATSLSRRNSGPILFRILDQNEDGAVSLEEIQAGPQSIRSQDFDGDESVSVDELDHTRSPFQQAADAMATPPVPVTCLTSEMSSSELIERLVTAYGESDTVVVDRLGFGEEEAKHYDADGNGRLDRAELRVLLKHPRPHAELIVRIGSREPGRDAVELRSGPTAEGVAVKSGNNGIVTLVIDDVHCEVVASAEQRTQDSLQETFKERFQAADNDANGYIDDGESQYQPLFSQSFTLFDRDRDGKIFEEEMTFAIQGPIVAGLSRARLLPINRGRDFFEILDANRDGRLSRRELAETAQRFDLWDANGDGQLTEIEVPQLYQLILDRGIPDLPGYVDSAAPSLATEAKSGPEWFQKMDRNGDGDVSRNEFLGTIPQFEELDLDHDDLVDESEAARASRTAK